MNTEDLKKFWEVKDNGFLPSREGAYDLLCQSPYDVFTKQIPDFIDSGTIRNEVVNYLNNKETQDIIDDDLRDINKNAYLDGEYTVDRAESLMRFMSYIASAYVHVPGQPVINILPKEIAKPFVAISKIVERPPILSYASYCLYNWHRMYKKPVELGYISLVQNFCSYKQAKRDEDWFILVHVEIEAKAAKGIEVIANLKKYQQDVDCMKDGLQKMLESLVQMSIALKRMPEQCSPDVYYAKVRPYIFSFENMVYEGEFNNIPQTFRGETGAQSSIVPAFQIALGVQHKESLLTTHLKDMRNYMPLAHREFLTNLEQQTTIRDFILNNQDNGLKHLYNACVSQLYEFRRQHLAYAVEYIQNKVPNPKGTGGTPYVPWLSQLAKETESYYL